MTVPAEYSGLTASCLIKLHLLHTYRISKIYYSHFKNMPFMSGFNYIGNNPLTMLFFQIQLVNYVEYT
jgi:hypothetical protein